jgi:hypothetical protein
VLITPILLSFKIPSRSFLWALFGNSRGLLAHLV